MAASATLVFSAALAAQTVAVSMSGAHVTAAGQLPLDAVRGMMDACAAADGELGAGTATLVLRDVPRNLRAESVVPRVRCGAGPGGGGGIACPLRVFDVAVKDTQRVIEADDGAPHAPDGDGGSELQAARRLLAEKRRQRDVRRVDLEVLTKQWRTLETWMDSVVRDGKDDRAAEVPGERDVYDMLESTQAKFTEMHGRRAALEEELEELEAEVARLERRLGAGRPRRGGAANRVYRARDLEIVFTVADATPPGAPLELVLEYAVDGVYWRPSYQMHLDAAGEAAVIDYYASVTSDAGEDWRGVEMSLSSSTAAEGRLPELKPRRIRVKAPPGGGGSRRRSSAKPVLKMAAFEWPDAGDRGEPEQEAEPEGVPPGDEMAPRDTATATTFTLPRKVTIRSDGAPHRVKVASLEVAARLRYACVPSRDSGFWMTARITNTSEFLLLPGPLAAFIDGQLAHQSRIGAAVNPGETFRQELAKHEGLRATVKAERAVNSSGSAFLASKKTVESVTRTVEVKNHRRHAVEVDVRDQAPFFYDVNLANSEKVSVSVVEPSAADFLVKATDVDTNDLPCPATVIDDANMVTWVRSVAPGDTLRLRLECRVEYKLEAEESVEYDQ